MTEPFRLAGDLPRLRNYLLRSLQGDELRAGFARRLKEDRDLGYHHIGVASAELRECNFSQFKEQAVILERQLMADPAISARLNRLRELGFSWDFAPSSEYAGGHRLDLHISRNPAAEGLL